MSPLPHRARKQRGSILVAMLGLVALLSAMLVSFLAEATERMKYSGVLEARTDLRPAAYSALEIALAVLSEVAEIDDGLRAPAQGWDDPMRYAELSPFPDGYAVQYEFIDESARLPLSQLGQRELKALFHVMDVPLFDAENLANKLLDWMDSNAVARLDSLDGDDYQRMDPPYWSANAVPQSWDEFALIDGYKDFFWDEQGKPTPYFTAFRSAVSLVNTGKVNINSASPLVVAALAEMAGQDPREVEEHLAGYDRKRGTADDPILRSADDAEWLQNQPLADYKIDLLRVRVTVRYGDASFQIDTLLRWKGAKPGASAQGGSRAIGRGYELFPSNAAAATGYPFELIQLRENARN